MPRIVLRFCDLQRRKIVGTWPTLKSLIENEDFPPGFRLGPNARGWFEDQVEQWLAARPSALDVKPPVRGGARLPYAERKTRSSSKREHKEAAR